MNRDRSRLIAFIRGEVMGPSSASENAYIARFSNKVFADPISKRTGALLWQPEPNGDLEEVLYFNRESPHRKYGVGLLFPSSAAGKQPLDERRDQEALTANDYLGVELEGSAFSTDEGEAHIVEVDRHELRSNVEGDGDDFEVVSADIRRPSTLGLSFCVSFLSEGQISVQLPRHRIFSWSPKKQPIRVNGVYEKCLRHYIDDVGVSRETEVWRRYPAFASGEAITFSSSELRHEKVISRTVKGRGLSLSLQLFPRKMKGEEGAWLITLVLKNESGEESQQDEKELVLYQAHFDVMVAGGSFARYPEVQRPFDSLDREEQSLALLYRESATWAIGHGCAAGWECDPGEMPGSIFADVMPTVQLPSMTPDIELDGQRIVLSMRSLSSLSDDGAGIAWESLEKLSQSYQNWIEVKKAECLKLDVRLRSVAGRHLDDCQSCLDRINRGLTLLKTDKNILRAFRLANLAMLLQQISQKQLKRREVRWSQEEGRFVPCAPHQSPLDIFLNQAEDSGRVGAWRPFQIAFLLMSLAGMVGEDSSDREIVDLIWFPTGGGKTEAYLAVAAAYMFHQRLLPDCRHAGRRDGTNVLMRYTLRMLTTQQFQRAASLISAMEAMRQPAMREQVGDIRGGRFSLGLWIGGDASPNSISEARSRLTRFSQGDIEGNPLVLTECPWCRAAIGRAESQVRSGRNGGGRRRGKPLVGIVNDGDEGPRLHCPDSLCFFGSEFERLPVEVIDERIYKYPPSMVISTADKFAILAFRPQAGALFGRALIGSTVRQVAVPPGLIIQDELHLISGPLGTMYALYEGVIERLCSVDIDGRWSRPKIIASTATIRGAEEQVKALYARVSEDSARAKVKLFPSPGLEMGDSFFGRYARVQNGDVLEDGRLYLGVHAVNYGSVLTAQVRAFSASLFAAFNLPSADRDPWWTLLTFYNSIRELSGAKTLFDSDIPSRLKFIFNREGFAEDRRRLRSVQELTSRLSQAEIVAMLDRLGVTTDDPRTTDLIDACLASNIIEVGVDIDRLSLMAVVGQPKNTATYIQVTGRVGRRWWERPGLILMIFNPGKSRDRSHYEQFHSYHRRLYERVEPTTATPFAVSTIQRGLGGVLIAWARQFETGNVWSFTLYERAINFAFDLMVERCKLVQSSVDQQRSVEELTRVRDSLVRKWRSNPQQWEEFPQRPDGEYLMLWPGQYASGLQRQRGVVVPSSMRQVDLSADLEISRAYLQGDAVGVGTGDKNV